MIISRAFQTKAPSINEFEISLMNFQSFKDKKPLNNSVIQEYYKLLFDEVAQMKPTQQKEDKDFSAKTVIYSRKLIINFKF